MRARSWTLRPFILREVNDGGLPPRLLRLGQCFFASSRSGRTHRIPRRWINMRGLRAPYIRHIDLHACRSLFRTARSNARNGNAIKHSRQQAEIGTLTCCHDQREGTCIAIRHKWILLVNPSRERPSHSLLTAPFFRLGSSLARPCSVAVCLDLGRVQRGLISIDLTRSVDPRLQQPQNALPRPVSGPACETVIAGLPWPVSCRYIAPWRIGL